MLESLGRFYSGQSMRGTFLPGDYLIVVSSKFNEVEPGDVVLFKNRGKNRAISEFVHRIVNRSGLGFITQGDANPIPDRKPLTTDNFIGRVEFVERRNKRRKVANGKWGLMSLKMKHLRQQIKKPIWFFLKTIYRWLARKIPLERIWNPEIEQIRFQTRRGPLTKFIHKGKTVGLKWGKSRVCSIRKPFDFILLKKYSHDRCHRRSTPA